MQLTLEGNYEKINKNIHEFGHFNTYKSWLKIMKILKYLELKHNENTKILSPLPLFYLFTYLEHS